MDGREEGEVFLQLIGRHNVYNALGAIALGVKEGLSLDAIKKGMFAFLGTKRRMQLIGECNGIRVFDDYGHHPTEIKTTLEGLKASFDNRVICIFQPHRYTRTRDLLETFPDSFAAADQVIITEVYSANEPKIRGVSGKLIVDKMKPFRNGDVRFIAQKSNIANQIIGELRKGDLVITMGAGDLHTVSKEIVARLKSKEL
ncbi:MAG: UDP-N-acetylmuramate--alanine ligase [Candidatus Marinamargulisbacteria bacterium]